MKTALQAAISSIIGFAAFLLMVFWPAGTFDYWQGWAFIAVFAAATTIPSIYLAATNPAALKRRMQAGPAAETRLLQKSSSPFAFVSMGAMIVVSALDFRFGWSAVPAAVSVVGDVLVGVGLCIAMITTIQNGYAAANIKVESGQKVVSTGVYSRCPPPDVLRQRRADDRRSAGARVVLGTAVRDPGLGRARHSESSTRRRC